jgi:hypothetical protein
LSGCEVLLKIYNAEDQSLIELNTAEEKNIDMTCQNLNIKEYAKFTTENLNLIEEIDEQIFRHGHLNLK